jgi:hypothetical protein
MADLAKVDPAMADLAIVDPVKAVIAMALAAMPGRAMSRRMPAHATSEPATVEREIWASCATSTTKTRAAITRFRLTVRRAAR